jgi:hypothetical protein
MQENRGQRPDFDSAKTELSDAISKEKQSATEALHDARDEITRKAGEYASEAKDAFIDKAEGAQQNVSANMAAFGGAMRAASEHLANSDQRAASKFVLEAAGGIERLSSSLKNKPFEDVLKEVRSFGRQNSGALIAGSVLAGLALGRFIKSSTPNKPQTNDSESEPAQQPGGGMSSETFGSSSPVMESTDE